MQGAAKLVTSASPASTTEAYARALQSGSTISEDPVEWVSALQRGLFSVDPTSGNSVVNGEVLSLLGFKFGGWGAVAVAYACDGGLSYACSSMEEEGRV